MAKANAKAALAKAAEVAPTEVAKASPAEVAEVPNAAPAKAAEAAQAKAADEPPKKAAQAKAAQAGAQPRFSMASVPPPPISAENFRERVMERAAQIVAGQMMAQS